MKNQLCYQKTLNIPKHSRTSIQTKRITKMKTAAKAIETTGTIDAQHHLVPEENDINETEWLQAASKNSAFDFLKYPKEDIYTLSDGRPFYDEQ